MEKKALVVDADYFYVEFVSELLTKRGYTVTKAYDGKDGISKLEDLPHDVMFVDLIMPKVDGSQFIDFVRLKYGPNHFPIVALSGVMVEQLGSLNEIGADYYIAKGPIDKLTIQLNGLMAEIETQPQSPPDQFKVMQTGGVYPRRDAVGLLNALKFHQAIIESMAVGVIVVDTDARIVNVNPVTFEILGKSPTEVLNRPVLDIFPSETKGKLGGALKQVAKLPDRPKMSFLSDFNDRSIRTSVSVISLSSGNAGWVIVLEDTTCA
ncbi:MAG: response regulator [Desulfobacterales bacterium]|jgi:PAS domain S-box-containing protein